MLIDRPLSFLGPWNLAWHVGPRQFSEVARYLPCPFISYSLCHYQYFSFVTSVSEVIQIMYNFNNWSHGKINQNLGLGHKYLVYTGYFRLLSVQGSSVVVQCISNFRQPCILKSKRIKLRIYGVPLTLVFNVICHCTSS